MDELFPIFVIGIVFAFVIYIVKMSNEHEKQKMKIKSGFFERENDDIKQEIQELKERIVTLEKIVTDDNFDLKKEFDKLNAA